jgi:hypothetical protein
LIANQLVRETVLGSRPTSSAIDNQYFFRIFV